MTIHIGSKGNGTITIVPKVVSTRAVAMQMQMASIARRKRSRELALQKIKERNKKSLVAMKIIVSLLQLAAYVAMEQLYG